MAWREVLKRLHVLPEAVLDMPDADRIALARELLPPGFVVAREVGELKRGDERDDGMGWVPDARWGWNACRAAMLGEE